jgi:hypothetical protein
MLKTIKIFFIVFFAATAYSQDKVLDSYNLFNLKSVADAEVSPDGKYISYTVNIPVRLQIPPERITNIFLS